MQAALENRRRRLPAFSVRATTLGAAGSVGNFHVKGGARPHGRIKTDGAAHQNRERLAQIKPQSGAAVYAAEFRIALTKTLEDGFTVLRRYPRSAVMHTDIEAGGA